MRRYFLFGVFCLVFGGLVLGACGRAPVASGGLGETAGKAGALRGGVYLFVFGDEGGTYVLDGPTGALERYGKGGRPQWRTVVSVAACRGCRVLDFSRVDAGFRLLTARPGAVVVSVLSPAGETITAHPFAVSGARVVDAVASMDRTYVLSSTGGGHRSFVEAFGVGTQGRWSKAWKRTLAGAGPGANRDGALAVSPQGDLYLGRARSLDKYSADGLLLWSRALHPSRSSHPQQLTASGDGSVYYARKLVSGATASFELTRFGAGGRALWTRRLPTGARPAESYRVD